jgi:AraC-like DNA-binding protein
MIEARDLLTKSTRSAKIGVLPFFAWVGKRVMDILSDTLRVVRMTGSIFFNAELFSRWAFISPSPEELRTHLRSHSECLTLFHILHRGHCWITLDGVASFLMQEGDAVVFPRGNSHTMSSFQKPNAVERHPLPVEVLHGPSHGEIPSITFGGGGEATELVCGYLQCDQKFNPMVGSLPTALWLRHADHADAPLTIQDDRFSPWCILPVKKGQWLETTLQYTTNEARTRTLGNAAMLGRLSEVMYVEVLRLYAQQLPAEDHNWLAAVRDRSVGSVLELMHSHPERAWTVEDLASAAAISRSGLAQRFTSLIGETPMQYLTSWRMQLAQHLLRESNMTIGEIAARTGYASEVAFNHAFKREVGRPPVAWRRQRGGENG